MGLLVFGSLLITRRLSSERSLPRWQNLAEVILGGVRSELREISREDAENYFPFIGTLFLFILVSNLLTILPGYVAPTSFLTTTAALAVLVFLAVPLFGIAKLGVIEYIAPKESRIGFFTRTSRMTHAEAQKYVEKKDADRSGFIKKYFKADAHDPPNFDLVVNTGEMGIEMAYTVVAAMIRKRILAEEEAKRGRASKL
jgi:hypothetical protein